MTRFLTSGIWKDIKGIRRGRPWIRAAIAYVTAPELLPLRRGDVLIVNASDSAIRCGETSAKALGALFRRGVKLFSEPMLHAKVLLIGDTAVVGSANMSTHSSSRLIEAAVTSTAPSIVGPLRSYLHQLADERRKIDARFIARIGSIPVSPRRPFGGPRRGAKPRLTSAHKTWLVVLRPTEDDPDHVRQISRATEEAEGMLEGGNSELDYFFFTGNGSILRQARQGDSVIMINRRNTHDMRGAQVISAVTILTVRNIGRRTYFFVEVPASVTQRSWSRFNTAARKAGITIGRYTGRTVTTAQVASLERHLTKTR
jgi:hypothetical protein